MPAASTRTNIALIPVLILAVVLSVFVFVLYRTAAWIDRAKLVLSVVMLAFSLAGFLIFCLRRQIYGVLCRLETAADNRRDDLMFELTATRARLSVLEERFKRRSRPDQARLNRELLQHAGAALMLVLQKETALIKWGLWAARFGKSAYDYLNEWLKN